MSLQVKLLLADQQRTSDIARSVSVFARGEPTFGNDYGGKGPQTKLWRRLPAGNPELPHRLRPPRGRAAVYRKSGTEFAEIAAACRVRGLGAVTARPLDAARRGSSARDTRRYSSGRHTRRRYRLIRIHAVNCIGVAHAIAAAARPRRGPVIGAGVPRGSRRRGDGGMAAMVVWRRSWYGTVWWRRTLVDCSVGNDGVDPAGRCRSRRAVRRQAVITRGGFWREEVRKSG